MKKDLIAKTSLPTNYTLNIREKYGMMWVDSLVPPLFQTLFTSIVTALKLGQTVKAPRAAFIFKDNKGEFMLGAVMSYFKPDDAEEDDKGNWAIEFTFDEKDIGECDTIIDNLSDEFYKISDHELHITMNGNFRSIVDMNKMYSELIISLKNLLDTNASDAEEYEVEFTDIFNATVGVENGEKVMSIVPGGHIKKLIKADSTLI